MTLPNLQMHRLQVFCVFRQECSEFFRRYEHFFENFLWDAAGEKNKKKEYICKP